MDALEAQRLPDLSGRLALVTGGGGGLGQAIAADLTAAGAAVALVGDNPNELARVVADIDHKRGAALGFARNLADLDSLESIASEVRRDLGSIDILINIPQVICLSDKLATTDVSVVETALRVNVVAPVVLSAAFIRGMRARRWGRIVNVTGIDVGHAGSTVGTTASALAKAAIEAHTFNLAGELACSGVTVNLYRPGKVDAATHRDARDPFCPTRTIELVRSDQRRGNAVCCAACSARFLVSQLEREDTGSVWDFSIDPDQPRIQSAVPGADMHHTSSSRDASWSKWFPAALPEWLSR